MKHWFCWLRRGHWFHYGVNERMCSLCGLHERLVRLHHDYAVTRSYVWRRVKRPS